MIEKVARAIDPDAWKLRDEDIQRRDEWESIKVGWSDITFEQWANRFVGKSLEKAKLAIEAMPLNVLREALEPFARIPDASELVGRGAARDPNAMVEVYLSDCVAAYDALERVSLSGQSHD